MGEQVKLRRVGRYRTMHHHNKKEFDRSKVSFIFCMKDGEARFVMPGHFVGQPNYLVVTDGCPLKVTFSLGEPTTGDELGFIYFERYDT
jgi:hypothetical protein